MAAWLLLITACGFAVVMAKIMQNVFFAMYSDAPMPSITRLFLHAGSWGFILPLVPGIPAYLNWTRGRLEKTGPFWMLVMHIASVAVLALVALGILWPFLTTTFQLR